MSAFMRNLRFSGRQFRRSPGFFATAVLMIAMGIAVTTQIFALVDALLLRPLPVKGPQSLVQLFEQQPRRPADPFFAYAFSNELAQYSTTLHAVAGHADTTRAMEWNGRVERIHVIAVTYNFFADLGVGSQLGRVISGGDHHVAVLSASCWRRSFGQYVGVIGQVIRLQGHSYTIIGVTPQEFNGTTVDSSPDLWIPFPDMVEFSQRPSPSLADFNSEVIARLRPGVTAAQAQQETAALWSHYLEEDKHKHPENYEGLSRGKLEIRPLEHGISGLRDQSKTALLLLLAGTGMLFLMVCANVGGLLLARVTARERDTAVRVALGASQWRILQQWLMESVILSVSGWCAGLCIAYGSMPLLLRLLPPARGYAFDPAEKRVLALNMGLDGRIALFSLAALVATILLCMVAPAWQSWRADVIPALKDTISDRRNRVFQSVLCGLQIALCTTILFSAGLVMKSLSNLRSADAGVDVERVTVFSIDPRMRVYDAARTWAMQRRLLEGVLKLPGAEGAALANRGLMQGIGLGNAIVFPGETGDGVINTSSNSVSPEYFGVMGIRLLAGRNFGPSDMSEEGTVDRVVVNEAFVRKFLKGQNPLGEKFGNGRRYVKPQYEIIGVVSDTKYRSMREVPPPTLYLYEFGPKAYPEKFILHVRSHGDPHAMVEPVRQLVRSIDPELPVFQIATLSDEVDQSLWQERLLAALTSCFGAFALALAALGLYGIMSYFIARRRREIGLRLALGAGSWDVLWLVVRSIVPTVAWGTISGAALSWGATTWVRSVLYGVQPFDPLAGGGAVALLLIIVITASAAPAFRALRLDPASTLRGD